jgi:ribonuclease HI
VIFEGDSKQVVKAILSKGPNCSRYRHIVGDIHEILKTLRRWKIRHVKRAANEAAHDLAKDTIRELGEKIWIDETLTPLVRLLP